MKRVYKVVSREFGELHSAMAHGLAEVVYDPKKWVEAPKWLAEKGYHLFAFKSLECAMEFAKEFRGHEVWEAEAEEVTETLPPFCDLTKLARGRLTEEQDIEYPSGTVMCKRLR